MQLEDAITSRRTVREYTAAEVPRQLLEALLHTTVQSPSARNRQPWFFCVLTGRHRIDEYAQRAKQHLLDGDASLEVSDLRTQLLNPSFDIFYHAPAVVIVCARNGAPQDVEDCCVAAQTFMLAARGHDLGTCWVGLARPWLNLPTTKHELGLPAECQIVAPIVVGHPRQWPPAHGRLEPVVRWIE